MKLKIKYLVVALFCALSLYVAYSLINADNSKYDYLAKRVQIDNPNKAVVNFVPLRERLESYVNDIENPNDVSVYFEYLPTGISIQINEKSEQVAASLMKVPAVMDIYKASELGYIDLNKKVKLKSEWLNDEYGTLYKKGEGYELTIKDAIRLVLSESDNTAFLLLWESIQTSRLGYVDKSLNYLDVSYKNRVDERVEISPESYASILKCLYLACFNTFDDSNEMLEILTTSTFNNRLVKLLPEEIKVAHKIGSFSKVNQSDCGIVYLELKNYLLCIMVKGSDEYASKIIADLSYVVFENISNIK